MFDRTMISRYLVDVDSYLHVDRARRQRVLAEIEGHLHDAVEAHIAAGVQPHDAMRRATAELGPPRDVAMAFSATPTPARSVRGWRGWAPIVPAVALLAVGLVLSAWSLYALVDGSTLGRHLVLRYSLLYTAVVGVLAAATYVAIRNGDRDPVWRRAAWGFAALTGVFVATNIAL